MLDYAATTPGAGRLGGAARAMSADLALRGDECVISVHHSAASAVTQSLSLGPARAQARIEAARAHGVAGTHSALRPADLVFTSGATESNNLALLGIARASAGKTRHIVTSKIEHKAVLDPCKQLEREGFSGDATSRRILPASCSRRACGAALRPDTVLVSIMHANNETGVIQDIARDRRDVPRARHSVSRRRCAVGRQAARRRERVAASTCSRSPRTRSMARRASARSTCIPRFARGSSP